MLPVLSFSFCLLVVFVFCLVPRVLRARNPRARSSGTASEAADFAFFEVSPLERTGLKVTAPNYIAKAIRTSCGLFGRGRGGGWWWVGGVGRRGFICWSCVCVCVCAFFFFFFVSLFVCSVFRCLFFVLVLPFAFPGCSARWLRCRVFPLEPSLGVPWEDETIGTARPHGFASRT